MKKILKLIFGFLLVALSGCSFDPVGTVYANGKKIIPENLGVKSEYSFRFVEKWRISHKWLSGPVELRGCSYSDNPFKRGKYFSDLKIEKNSPRLQWGSIIEEVEESNKYGVDGLRIRLRDFNGSDAYTLGTSRGNFSKFSPLCYDYLRESYDGFSLYIIKPDGSKGTDSWIANASEVQLNGRTWLVQKVPPADYGSAIDSGKGSMVQRWVLPIPDTGYWFVLVMYSSLKYSIMEHSEAHKNAERIFDELIKSVHLDPIYPIIDQKRMIKIERCTQRAPNSEVSCPFEAGSISLK